jgi:hypothetical protein
MPEVLKAGGKLTVSPAVDYMSKRVEKPGGDGDQDRKSTIFCALRR